MTLHANTFLLFLLPMLTCLVVYVCVYVFLRQDKHICMHNLRLCYIKNLDFQITWMSVMNCSSQLPFTDMWRYWNKRLRD